MNFFSSSMIRSTFQSFSSAPNFICYGRYYLPGIAYSFHAGTHETMLGTLSSLPLSCTPTLSIIHSCIACCIGSSCSLGYPELPSSRSLCIANPMQILFSLISFSYLSRLALMLAVKYVWGRNCCWWCAGELFSVLSSAFLTSIGSANDSLSLWSFSRSIVNSTTQVLNLTSS